MSKQIVTLSGARKQVVGQIRAYRMQNKSVREIDYRVYGEYQQHQVATLEVEPYSPEEEQEIEVYGDPAHEAYLLSEQYEEDRRSEQFDWIKNETT